MNLLLSSDDNYARHLGVAMYSLLAHNKKASQIQFFIVANEISQENISKLKHIVHLFENASLHFIDSDSYIKHMHLDMPWPISMSAYARLFTAEMLSKDIDRVLYLDCDMIINHDLSELWNYDLKGNCIGAVQDLVSPKVKVSVGMDPLLPYFNSGMLLVDLRKWRELNVGQRAVDFIKEHHGYVIHHDQGVLNGVLKGQWLRLPFKYNVMTVHYLLTRQEIQHYYKDEASFYDEDEVLDAKFNPYIIHYTPSFTSRPWQENCLHPLRSLYHITLLHTNWRGVNLEKNHLAWYQRLIYWRYLNLPF